MTPDCHISERVKGQCDKCGDWPARLHVPEALHGWYCERCCPVCGIAAKRAAARRAEQQPVVQSPDEVYERETRAA